MAAAVVATLVCVAAADARPPLWGFHAGWFWYCPDAATGDAPIVAASAECPDGEAPFSAEEQVAGVARAGAETIRIQAAWSQRRPPDDADGVADGDEHGYNFAPLDILYRAAREAGLRPVLMLMGVPEWARDPGWRERCPAALPCGYPPSRERLASFRAWVEAVMRRYPDALAIEVWNEPNVPRFFAVEGGEGERARRYAELLHRVHRARVATGFRGAIVSAGLSPAPTAVGFLRRLYRHSRNAWFDGIGLHPYPEGRPFVVRMNARIDAVLRVRRRNHHRGAKLWLTELGVRGAREGYPRRSVAPRRQGPVIERLYRAAARRPVAAVHFYTFAELPHEGPYLGGFGVVTSTLEPKPAYCHLQVSLGGVRPGAGDPCGGWWWRP